jgi:phosphoribosylanthranilate isomerase
MEKTMKRTRIKMCGTTTLEDAEKAVRLGVDALGFIFYEKSPRYITPIDAREIISHLPAFMDFVGVFVGKEISEVVEIVRKSGINHVQLHGNENIEYCQKLIEKLPCCKVIKAFRVSSKSKAEDFSPYQYVVSGFLLDTYLKGEPGGTGEVFDWEIIKKLNLQRPLILAGGLNPDNITDAVSSVEPYAVDINSGVEVKPGVKDYIKLSRLIQHVRESDAGFSLKG